MQNGSRYAGYHDDGVSERVDLCAMVVPPDTIVRNMERTVMFYDAAPNSPTDRDPDREHFFAFGYPSKLFRLDCAEHIEAVDLSQVHVQGTYVPPDRHGLPRLKINIGEVMGERCKGDFDGFSGGPVFSIHADLRTVRFEGITLTSGGGHLRFAPAKWVASLCEAT